jgi:hypothetical protein
MGQEGHSQREGRVAEKGREPKFTESLLPIAKAPRIRPAMPVRGMIVGGVIVPHAGQLVRYPPTV